MAQAHTSLEEADPVLIVDSREQDPLVFGRLKSIRGTLLSGDYSIAGAEQLFGIERKSLIDLAGVVGRDRERFERELLRLRGYPWRRLLIVGTQLEVQRGIAFSKVTPNAVFGSLSAWECRFDVPIVWCNTPEAAAARVERWALYYVREVVKNADTLRKAQNPEGSVAH